MLFYKSYPPSIPLDRLVARYMIITDDKKHEDWQQMDVAPNGLAALGFSFGENFRYHTSPEDSHEISFSNVIGVHSCTYTASWKYPINLFVIVFKPVGLFMLLREDMGALRNNLTSFNLIGLKESEAICENLSELGSHEDRIILIEGWLKKKLSGNTLSPGITEHIAQTIIERKGDVVITDLSTEFNINKKYIERHFNLELGLSPKEFAGIIRFNYMNMLIRQQSISWKELIYLGNFYDQSHLIKHFHRITGLTPAAFKKKADERPEAQFIKKHNIYELIALEHRLRMTPEVPPTPGDPDISVQTAQRASGLTY